MVLTISILGKKAITKEAGKGVIMVFEVPRTTDSVLLSFSDQPFQAPSTPLWQ